MNSYRQLVACFEERAVSGTAGSLSFTYVLSDFWESRSRRCVRKGNCWVRGLSSRQQHQPKRPWRRQETKKRRSVCFHCGLRYHDSSFIVVSSATSLWCTRAYILKKSGRCIATTTLPLFLCCTSTHPVFPMCYFLPLRKPCVPFVRAGFDANRNRWRARTAFSRIYLPWGAMKALGR